MRNLRKVRIPNSAGTHEPAGREVQAKSATFWFCHGLAQALSAKTILFIGGQDRSIPAAFALALEEQGGGTVDIVDARCPFALPGHIGRSTTEPEDQTGPPLSFPRVSLLRSTTEQLIDRNKSLDLVFIDVDESFAGIEHEFATIRRVAKFVLLRSQAEPPGGKCSFPGIRQFLQRLKRPRLEISIVPYLVLIDNRRQPPRRNSGRPRS